MQGVDILLVEDDEVLAELVCRNLQIRGNQVRVAADVEGALRALRTQRYDVTMLDINLPDRTGWDVLRTALHERTIQPENIDGKMAVLPVIVLSAVRVSPARLAEFHPLAYLPKPFPIEALLRLVVDVARHKYGDEQVV